MFKKILLSVLICLPLSGFANETEQLPMEHLAKKDCCINTDNAQAVLGPEDGQYASLYPNGSLIAYVDHHKFTFTDHESADLFIVGYSEPRSIQFEVYVKNLGSAEFVYVGMSAGNQPIDFAGRNIKKAEAIKIVNRSAYPIMIDAIIALNGVKTTHH